jgi:hypothetical protein
MVDIDVVEGIPLVFALLRGWFFSHPSEYGTTKRTKARFWP